MIIFQWLVHTQIFSICFEDFSASSRKVPIVKSLLVLVQAIISFIFKYTYVYCLFWTFHYNLCSCLFETFGIRVGAFVICKWLATWLQFWKIHVRSKDIVLCFLVTEYWVIYCIWGRPVRIFTFCLMHFSLVFISFLFLDLLGSYIMMTRSHNAMT